MDKFEKWVSKLQETLPKVSKPPVETPKEQPQTEASRIREEISKEKKAKQATEQEKQFGKSTKSDRIKSIAETHNEPSIEKAYSYLRPQIDQLDILKLAGEIQSKKKDTVAEHIFSTLDLETDIIIPQSVKNDIKNIISWKYQALRSSTALI